jgi:uncharacterized membrane protein
MTSLIVTIIVGLIIISCGISLLFGVGTGFISGISNMSEFEKSKVDYKKLGRSVGVFVIIIGLFFIIMSVINYLNPQFNFVIKIIEVSFVIIAIAILAIFQTKNNGFIKNN